MPQELKRTSAIIQTRYYLLIILFNVSKSELRRYLKESTAGNASHRDKRQRTDKSLEELCKSEQAQTGEEKEEETEVSEEPMKDSGSETKPASWSFLDGIDKELLERVANANEGGSQSESLEGGVSWFTGFLYFVMYFDP
jgi:hypothetical protein